MVLAHRPGAPRPVAGLAADPQTELLGLRALTLAGTRALLSEWSPEEPVEDEFALACERATGGNPFLLTRLAAGLSEQGVAFSAVNASRVSVAGAEAVRDAVAATLARLEPAAVALAQAVAVLGDGADLGLAEELAGIGAADAAAETLAQVGVLEDGRPLRFVHAIVRDAVIVRLPAAVRSALH